MESRVEQKGESNTLKAGMFAENLVAGYPTNAGLLREDVLRQSHGPRPDEMMRYPSTNNVRISEAQIQNNRGGDDLNRSVHV